MIGNDRAHLFVAVLAFQTLVALTAAQNYEENTYYWESVHFTSENLIAYVGISSYRAYSPYIKESITIRNLEAHDGGQNYLKVQVDFFQLRASSSLTDLGTCVYGADTVSFDTGSGYNITWCGTLYAEQHIFRTDRLSIRYNRGTATNGPAFGFRIYPVSRSEEISWLEVRKEPRLIYSPIYPNMYEANKDYRLTLYVPPGDTIRVQALSMDVEYAPTCSYDYINFESSGSGVILAGPYCGRELFTFSAQVTTVLHFHTDQRENEAGYVLAYWLHNDTELHPDLSGDGSSHPQTIWIIVGVLALIIIILTAALVLCKRDRKQHDRDSRRRLRDGPRPRPQGWRREGFENSLVYTINQLHGDEFDSPPPYTGLHTASDVERSQIDAQSEPPPSYEELDPSTLPHVQVEQVIQPPQGLTAP